jgi:hypothetical protein
MENLVFYSLCKILPDYQHGGSKLFSTERKILYFLPRRLILEYFLRRRQNVFWVLFLALGQMNAFWEN